MNLRAAFSALALAIAALPPALAHHDTEAMIARFTARIDAGEATAALYYRRATEYRVLRAPEQAEADLLRALGRDQDFAPAHRELAILLADRGELEKALRSAHRAIECATHPAERGANQLLLARLLAGDGALEAALAACERAFEIKPTGEVEWYLLRAELLGQLGRDAQRPPALAAGYAATGSIVLRNAWVDALLDTRQLARALPVIETELASSRLKSTWLLRRARARVGLGQHDAARKDLQSCLEELAGRIHPRRPDLTLVADRGLAHALLGEREAAQTDLRRAREGGADPWVTAALERSLAPGAR